MAENKIKITQIKSSIGYRKRAKDTLIALRIRKMHQSAIHDSSPAVKGMIKSIQHLVKVEKIS